MADAKDVKVDVDFDFEKCSQEEALAKLGSNVANGLSESAVPDLRRQWGPNKLEEVQDNKLLKFLGYMWNPLSWCMEVAAIIAIGILDYVDFILIILLLLLNASIGYYEEANADGAIGALMASLSPKAKVLRDGKFGEIDAADLVPGDIVLVKFGEVLPADIKIMGNAGDDEPLLIDQAALTGESLPVKRFAGQVGYSGSIVKQGESKALVYGTGPNTFFGKAAALIASSGDQSGHLQQVMTTIGFTCVITILLWVVIQLAVQFGVYKHECGPGEGGCPTLTNMLVIIVGGIPIAMPTVLSVTLALGAYKLAEKGAIVSRLTSIEEMAGMDVLCSDKTGTLTLNKLSVDKTNLEPKGRFVAEDILFYAALSSRIEGNEPIDVCLHNSYNGKDTLWDSYECFKYSPFNPTDKRTVAFINTKADPAPDGVYPRFRVAKGAPQVVLGLAHNLPEIKTQVEERILEYASRGYRALGVAVAEGDGADGVTKWEFVGLIPLFDPPRHDTKLTIEQAHGLGIGVKMITGDQLPIGVETARQLGMGTNMYTTDVIKSGMTGGLVEGSITLDELIEQADGFAEVFPEHKYEIVKRLQDSGHICGMTGDGVNDAPALKKSDVGIAVADATDAARSAADMVLTEPGLGVIIDAVIGSREIFQRMKSYAKYTISVTIRVCFTFGLITVIYNWYFPPLLIVLLAIFNDGAMIALSKDLVTASAMPDAWFLSKVFTLGFAYGLVQAVSSIVLFHLAARTDTFPEMAEGLQSLNVGDGPTGPAGFCQSRMDAPGGPAYFAAFNSQGAGYPAGTKPMEQCIAEVTWVRESMLRTLMYANVSISGMALIFVVRTKKYSFASMPAPILLVAFALSQTASSLIAGFGFNGYTTPRPSSNSCYFCASPFLGVPGGYSGPGPIANTEGVHEPSIIGCGWYVLVAWIWSLIWHMGMDPLKFAVMYIVNEDGFREHSASLWNSNGLVSKTGKSKVSLYLTSRTPNPELSKPSAAALSATASASGMARRSGITRRSQVKRGSYM
eukprot:jgi/Tetstr1/426842/TSEL_017057.t1